MRNAVLNISRKSNLGIVSELNKIETTKLQSQTPQIDDSNFIDSFIQELQLWAIEMGSRFWKNLSLENKQNFFHISCFKNKLLRYIFYSPMFI